MEKILNYNELVEAVETKDRKRLCDALVSCAITDIRVVRLIPNLDKVGIIPDINEERKTEIENKLQKICATWKGRK